MTKNMRIFIDRRLCSCCLEAGRLTHLWFMRAGLYSVLFCPECDTLKEEGES